MSHLAVLILEDGAKLVLEEKGAEKQRKCRSDLAKERSIGKEHCVARCVTENETHLQRLPAPNVTRRVVNESQIDFELRCLHIGIDLADLQIVALAVKSQFGTLADAPPVKVKLVDKSGCFETINVINLAKTLTARL